MHLLDIDQLRTFVAIADTGSFTRAADIVHKTQSAVSMQMKRLEERVGRAVFERDGRASQPHRGRRAPPRLRAPHRAPELGMRRLLQRGRPHRPRPPRPARRLRRLLPARDPRPLLALEPARRGHGHLRADAEPARPHPERRPRPRHHHPCRPPRPLRDRARRAAAVGDLGPPCRSTRRRRCRSRSGARPATGASRRPRRWRASAAPSGCSS